MTKGRQFCLAKTRVTPSVTAPGDTNLSDATVQYKQNTNTDTKLSNNGLQSYRHI